MTAWTKSTIMWPRDILAQDGRMKEARILTWGYNSGVVDSSTQTAQEYTIANAGNLCEELGYHRAMDGTVCCSFSQNTIKRGPDHLLLL